LDGAVCFAKLIRPNVLNELHEAIIRVAMVLEQKDGRRWHGETKLTTFRAVDERSWLERSGLHWWEVSTTLLDEVKPPNRQRGMHRTLKAGVVFGFGSA
jgi:hypothetical protein